MIVSQALFEYQRYWWEAYSIKPSAPAFSISFFLDKSMQRHCCKDHQRDYKCPFVFSSCIVDILTQLHILYVTQSLNTCICLIAYMWTVLLKITSTKSDQELYHLHVWFKKSFVRVCMLYVLLVFRWFLHLQGHIATSSFHWWRKIPYLQVM